jgi:hypothetical protein
MEALYRVRAQEHEKRMIQQEKLPAQKRYCTTEAGRARLKHALLQPSEAPAIHNDFLLRLAWAECLSASEIEAIIDEYRLRVETALSMCQNMEFPSRERNGADAARGDAIHRVVGRCAGRVPSGTHRTARIIPWRVDRRRYAAAHPQKVCRLVLLAPGGIAAMRSAALLKTILFSMQRQKGAARMKRLVFGRREILPEASRFFDLLQQHYVPRIGSPPLLSDEQMKRIACPVLMMTGGEDAFFNA